MLHPFAQFRKGPSEAVGLDIGSSSVKGVRVAKVPSGLRLVQFATQEIPPEASQTQRVQAIRSVLQSLGGKDLHVITAVGGTGTVLRSVLLPKMTPAELRGALAYEADKYIPFKPDEAHLDFAILGDRPGGRMEVVLAAARKELVNAHLELLREAQISPHALDLETLALSNAWEISHPTQGSETAVLIQIGVRSTILVFLQGLQFAFSREILIGADAFTQAVAEGLTLDALQAEKIKCEPGPQADEVEAALHPVWEKWLTQARASFDFYEDQYGRRVERIILSGPSAGLSGFREWVEATAGIPTENWNPVSGLSAGELSPELESARLRLGVAVGLAIRGVDSRLGRSARSRR